MEGTGCSSTMKIELPKIPKILLIFAVINLCLSVYLGNHRFGLCFFNDRNVGGDSFYTIHKAINLTNHNNSIYEELFFKQHVKFLYPPTSLLVFLPFKDRPFEDLKFIFSKIINRVFVIISLIGIFSISNRLFFQKHYNFGRLAVIGAFSALIFSFYPFFKAFYLGQIQVWINCFLILSILAWLSKKEKLAGLYIGICALIKPTYGIFLLWGVIRKKTNFVISMLYIIYTE